MRWNRTVIAVAVPVAAVAVFAGIVSYTHVYALAMRTDQGSVAAHLLPLSLDGLIVAGSVILLAGSVLGWICVVPGVAGTLFANTVSMLPHGHLAATVATWPAVAFTMATFVLERWLRSQVSPVAEGDGQGGQEDDDIDPLNFAMEAGVSTALYRLYDSDHELLYAGISYHPERRYQEHKREKDWGDDIAEMVTNWYPSRSEAADAEAAAIFGEHPKHNKALWHMHPSLKDLRAGSTYGIQCAHSASTTTAEAVVQAYLHGRDCLGEAPSQRKLSEAFGIHRTKVAALVGHLNGHGQPELG